MNSAWLWSRARLAINQNKNISRYQTTNLLKTRFLFLVINKGQKEDKSKFVTKFVGIIVTNIRIFSSKNISQVASKTSATQCFFTDHLNLKIVNKTTCRTPSKNPRQLWTQLKSFRTVAIVFRGFQDFLIYLVKYFWSLLSSHNLITQQCFAIAMYIKFFWFQEIERL